MKQVGILIEEANGRVKDSVLGVISYLRQKDVACCAFVISGSPGGHAEQLGVYGVHRIYAIEFQEEAQGRNPQFKARAVAEAMQAAGVTILFGQTSPTGRDLLPRLAALFDAPLVMDCTGVDLETGTVSTAAYSGKTEALYRLRGEYLFFGMRPNHHPKVPSPASPEVVRFQAAPAAENTITFLGKTATADQGRDLNEAKVIISGGRGLKNGENFQLLFDCARELEAAVGASRVAVDEGWVPYTMQVGQTGLKVNPRVYIACGISGSVQHFAGMKTAGLIIAVNTDPKAPMVKNADYYLLGDLFEIIPKLTQRLKARAAGKGRA